VIVFLDTSTILAACWSTKGLSHVLIEHGLRVEWRLITADYCVAEVERNVFKHPSGATRWNHTIRPSLEVVGSIYDLRYRQAHCLQCHERQASDSIGHRQRCRLPCHFGHHRFRPRSWDCGLRGQCLHSEYVPLGNGCRGVTST